jgi:hypothetical protein
LSRAHISRTGLPAILLLLTPPIFADTGAAARPAFETRTEGYEIQAPSEIELGRARRSVETARGRFEDLLGGPPARLAVVLFGSSDALQEFDAGSLTSRGLVFLPWVDDGLARPDASSVVPAAQGDAKRFRRTWSLSHEAGHLLLNARVDGDTGHPRDAGARCEPAGHECGGALLPAWFEEAVAAWCESPGMRRNRLERARRSLDDPIPLWKLFVMKRPEAVDLSDPWVASPDSERKFIDESFSVAQFLVAKEGKSILAKIGGRLERGAATTQALRDAEYVSPDVDQLQRDWLEWLAAAVPDPSPAPRAGSGCALSRK